MKLILLLSLFLGLSLQAEFQFITADTSTKEVLIVNRNGKTMWKYQASQKPEDVSFLKNGNILLCTKNQVLELTRDKKTVWEFSRKGELHSAQRLEDGNTLIGHTSEGTLYVVSPQGKILKSIKTTWETKNKHTIFRRVRQYSDGQIFVAHHGDGVCRVYDYEANITKILTHYKNRCFSATPLSKNKFLLTGKDKVKIVSADDKILWEIDIKDIPESKATALTSAVMLKNGNILVTNWQGHEKKNKRTAPAMIEISPEKKVVWKYDGGKNKCLIALDVKEEL